MVPIYLIYILWHITSHLKTPLIEAQSVYFTTCIHLFCITNPKFSFILFWLYLLEAAHRWGGWESPLPQWHKICCTYPAMIKFVTVKHGSRRNQKIYKKVRKSFIMPNINIFHQKFWQLFLDEERKIKICANTCFFFPQAIDIANRHDFS